MRNAKFNDSLNYLFLIHHKGVYVSLDTLQIPVQWISAAIRISAFCSCLADGWIFVLAEYGKK